MSTETPIPPPDDLSPETYDLLSRRGIRQALQALDLRPSRGRGQHFLAEPAVLYHILKAAELDRQDVVLEIGSGLGVLTSELLRRAGRVVAVEVDARLCRWLRERFGGRDNLTLVEGDILELAPRELVGAEQPYKVVANLPYAITSAVLRHLLEAEQPPRRVVVTVQWEVAQRITAEPPEMSLLALSVQYYGRPEIVSRVAAGSFDPVPQVDSAVLLVEVLPRPRIDLSPEAFFRLVRAGFRHPRRQLAKNLAGGLGRPKREVAALLEGLGIDPRRRAETIALEEWEAIGEVDESGSWDAVGQGSGGALP